jgi:hypothetical protein
MTLHLATSSLQALAFDETERIFTHPRQKRTEDYITPLRLIATGSNGRRGASGPAGAG